MEYISPNIITASLCPFTHSSCKRNEKLGRTIGHSQLHCSLSWELPVCKRMFFTSPLGPKSLCRKGLSWSSTAGTMWVGISKSEIQFISPLGSLENLRPQSCSMSNRGDTLLPSALVFFFFLNYSESRQGGKSSYLLVLLNPYT